MSAVSAVLCSATECRSASIAFSRRRRPSSACSLEKAASRIRLCRHCAQHAGDLVLRAEILDHRLQPVGAPAERQVPAAPPRQGSRMMEDAAAQMLQCLADLLQPLGDPVDDGLQQPGEQIAGTAEPGLAAAVAGDESGPANRRCCSAR